MVFVLVYVSVCFGIFYWINVFIKNSEKNHEISELIVFESQTEVIFSSSSYKTKVKSLIISNHTWSQIIWN